MRGATRPTKPVSLGRTLFAAIGIAVNTQRLAAKQLPEPKCWSDLARPEYDDLLQMGQPGQSGAARTTLITLVQLFGEEKAFDLIKRIHGNVGSYTRRATNAARRGAWRRHARRDLPL